MAGQRLEDVLGEPASALDGVRRAAVGRPPARRARPASGRRARPPRGAGRGTGAGQPDVADHRRDRGHRPLDVRRQRRQHPRVDRADHRRRRRPRPAAVATPTARPERTTRSTTSTPRATVTPRVAMPRAREPRSGPPSRPGSSTRRTPVPGRRRAPAQAGTLRRSWPSATNGWAATCRSRTSLNAFLTRRCSISRLSNRAATSRGRSSGCPGRLEVAAAQHLPVGAERRRRARPTAAPAPAPSSSNARSCAAREAPGSASRVPSSNQCSRTTSSGSSSSSRSSGRPLLRNRSRTTAGTSVDVGPASHSKPSAATVETAPPSVRSRSISVTS